jgi:hypothetical protein
MKGGDVIMADEVIEGSDTVKSSNENPAETKENISSNEKANRTLLEYLSSPGAQIGAILLTAAFIIGVILNMAF